MLAFILALRVFVPSRSDTVMEVLALRQPVAMLKRECPRPTLTFQDRLFWTASAACGCAGRTSLAIAKPETVIDWSNYQANLRRRGMSGSAADPVEASCAPS